jgi:riboflavin kinase
VYFGWAGLSASLATRDRPPGAGKHYKHMSGEVYGPLDALLGRPQEQQQQADQDRDEGAVYPMVMSIGWNPFYKNTVRSVEVHIMHDFEADFYDSHMNLLILGFIRPEYDYVDMESLIDDIKTDINVAGRSLTRPAYAKFARDAYLVDFKDKDDVAQ